MALPLWLKNFQRESEKLKQKTLSLDTNKLYIFGNSFSMVDGKDGLLDHERWPYIVAKEFNSEEINISVPGCPIGSSANQFEICRDSIQPNDILIVLLGVNATQFFFEDRPYISSLRTMEYYDCPDEYLLEEKIAVEHYEKWLVNPVNEKLFTINFLHSLDEIAQRLKLRTIVIRTYRRDEFDDDITDKRYPNLIISKGNLWNASSAEFDSKELFNYLKIKTNNYMIDYRANHFTPENHQVLADKLIACIKDGAPLDLTTGFHSKHVSLNNSKNLLDFLNLNKLTLGE